MSNTIRPFVPEPQPSPTTPAHLFIADIDGDGALDKEEEKVLLSYIDVDKNGRSNWYEDLYAKTIGKIAKQDGKNGLSESEKKQANKYFSNLMFVFDENNDKKIDFNEFSYGHYEKFDFDSNGHIDTYELEVTQQIARKDKKRGLSSSEKADLDQYKQDLLEIGDIDYNGKLSKEERQNAHYKNADVDKDGIISQAEAKVVSEITMSDIKRGSDSQTPEGRKEIKRLSDYKSNIMKIADGDKNGKLDANEQKKLLKIADTNKDGVVSEKEALNAVKKRK